MYDREATIRVVKAIKASDADALKEALAACDFHTLQALGGTNLVDSLTRDQYVWFGPHLRAFMKGKEDQADVDRKREVEEIVELTRHQSYNAAAKMLMEAAAPVRKLAQATILVTLGEPASAKIEDVLKNEAILKQMAERRAALERKACEEQSCVNQNITALDVHDTRIEIYLGDGRKMEITGDHEGELTLRIQPCAS